MGMDGDFDIDTDLDSALAADITLIKTYLSGEGIQLHTAFSKSGAVEEDAFAFFAMYLNDVENGAIASGDIDITGISVEMSKSTGGAAFSAVGITQPTFVKANGVVSVNYRFLAAQWELGDSYKLTVSGVSVTIGADTMVVPGNAWSASITEQVNVETKIDTIDSNVDLLIVDIAGVRETKLAKSSPVARIASLAFSNAAGDKDFSNVVVPAAFIPTTATILATYLWIMYRDRKDSSAALNKINAAAKTIRIKLSTGAWGTDDIIGMTMVNNDWETDASSRNGGDLMVGTVDIKSIMSTPAGINGKTFNVRTEETNAGEGITVTAASLTLYGIDSFIAIEYSL